MPAIGASMVCSRALVVLPLIAALLATPALPQSQETDKLAPFALDDLLTLMAAGVTPARVTTLVKERGVTFDFTPDVEQKLRLAGGDDSLLLEVAKASARRPPPPKPAPEPEPAPPPAPVDRTNEVVEKAIEAMGGLSVLEGWRDSVVVYRLSLFTPQGEVVVDGTASLAPERIRLDATAAGQPFVFVYDGQRAWSQSGGQVTALPPIEAEIARRETERPREILLGVHRGRYSARYLETRAVDGHQTDVLAVTNSRGEQVKLFVEASTGHVVRSVAPELVSGGGVVECETSYSDFRRVGDFVIPFREVAQHNGFRFRDMVIFSVRVNTGLDPALFTRPAAKPERRVGK